MGDIVATTISRAEACSRLAARFEPWPRAGLRWSTRGGYAAELSADGFAVRSLPRLTGAGLHEAVGRWRADGGAEVQVTPIALSGMRGNILGTIEGVSFGGLVLITISLLTQVGIVALLELRSGLAEKDALIAVLREVLGP
ncbi:MAG: hypothetical protein Q7S41_03115 [Candidatus Limnocylindria bacterium]|nr:hypothetical protein [Candidatus Limnocylindria bacterium]